MSSSNINHDNENITPAALLEQLVYVDTFMPEIDDPSQLDERLTAELSAFADESFIFPDEDKPAKLNDDEFNHTSNNRDEEPRFDSLQQPNNINTVISNVHSSLQNPLTTNLNATTPRPASQNGGNVNKGDILSNLPKVPVPPGAQSSLIAAGLSQTQIDALAALIAQHQGGANSNGQNGLSSFNVGLNNLTELTGGLNELSNNSSLNGALGSLNVDFINDLINPSQSLLNPNANGTHGPSNDDISPGVSPGITTGSQSRSNSIIKLENGAEVGGDVDLDKRRRNTAASARFRIKKKLKEQQLERNVRELNELTLTLEKKIQTLEMENKLLRNLVVEKGEQKNNDEVEFLKQRAKMSMNDGRSGSASGSSGSF